MQYRRLFAGSLGCLMVTLVVLSVSSPPTPAAETAGLRFEVRAAAGLWDKKRPGRVLVVLGKSGQREPRLSIGRTGLAAAPLLGADARADGENDIVATLDARSEIFPIARLSDLPVGRYAVQAVLHRNYDLNFPNAPGDLHSEVQNVTLDPIRGGLVRLELTQKLPDETLPADTDKVKFIKMESKLLSRFHGRPIYLRAAVVLPRDFDKEPEQKYPVRVHIGGYGGRYTSAQRYRADPAAPKFLHLQLDGAGPFGDPYQVNSANNGPYGDAITQELIPYVEQKYRGVGQAHARFTDGHSTGGWVSLALQVFYPEFFNGCWSFAPDPVDFRAYELINIYEDANAYVNRHGFPRPAMRQVNGDTVYDVRHECQLEVVLGLGNRWTISGKDWCAWNATFGPRGPDGRPQALWDGKTGAINRAVTEHWKKYDLRLVIETGWSTGLAAKLQGKLHIYVGDADDYFLNNAVRLLEKSLNRLDPPYEGTVTIGPAAGHGFHPLSDRQTLEAMWARFAKGQPR